MPVLMRGLRHHIVEDECDRLGSGWNRNLPCSHVRISPFRCDIALNIPDAARRDFIMPRIGARKQAWRIEPTNGGEK